MDIGFYTLIIPLFRWVLDKLMVQISSLPVGMMGSLLQTADGMAILQETLMQTLVSLIGLILFFFLLIILNIAVLKGIIWILTLQKKIKWTLILKYFFLTLLILVLAFIPILWAIRPLTPQNVNFDETWKLLMMFFIIFYFGTISFYFLAKSGKMWSAIKKAIIVGFTKIAYLIPLSVILYLILILVYLQGYKYSWYILIPLVSLLSFGQRIYIDSILKKV